MIKISLDDSIAREINSLTKEELKLPNNYAYSHELLWYGIDAVIHCYLFSRARRVYKNQISLEDFVREQNLILDTSFEQKISIPIKKVVDANIFIPVHKYWKSGINRRILLFNSDYGNKTLRFDYSKLSFTNIEEAAIVDCPNKLVNLESQYFVELGLKIAEEMFKVCVNGFNEYKYASEFDCIQSEKLNQLGKVLIDYYSKVIDELKNSN